MHRLVLPTLAFLFLAAPACAQGWRPFEVDLSQDLVNAALDRQQADARRAARTAPPEPEPESLREALDNLAKALVQVAGARVSFANDRVTLQADAQVFAIVRTVFVRTELVFEPRMRGPNVVEFRAVGGRQKWGSSPWETSRPVSVSSNLRKLSETLAEGELAGSITIERGTAGAADVLVVDLSSLAAENGIELHGVSVGDGQLTVIGATSLDKMEIELTGRDINDGLRGSNRDLRAAGLDSLLGWNAWVDVGRETPGRITVHGEADMPYLPTTRYAAVFQLEQIGPHRLRLTLEDVTVGGDTMDGFLRSRVGRGIKAWVMRKIYAQLDAGEADIEAAYERGEIGIRLSHTAPNVRIIDLRPGYAAGMTVRPGFTLDGLSIEPGVIRIGASLDGEEQDWVPVGPPLPPGPPTRGIAGALGE